MITTTQCDICDKFIMLTVHSKHLLEAEGWSVYCKKCADKLNLDKLTARKKLIKIYN
jgi:hypothetical protein